jgi:hypothetical protein
MKTTTVTVTTTTVKSAKGTYKYWRARWYDDSGQRRTRLMGAVSEVSKRQANTAAARLQHDLSTSVRQRNCPGAVSLAGFVADYLTARSELGPGTLALHEQTTRYLLGHFGDRQPIDRITRSAARAFKTALARGELASISRTRKPRPLSAATVDLHVRNARTMFGRALADDLVDANPFDRLSATPTVERDWHYVDEEEITQLLGATEGRPAWRLLLALGRRPGPRSG